MFIITTIKLFDERIRGYIVINYLDICMFNMLIDAAHVLTVKESPDFGFFFPINF